MDQLVMLDWKLIYYWTWLWVPRLVVCRWFYDLGDRFYKKSDDTSYLLKDAASVTKYKSECKKGFDQYFEAVYYGGGPDYLPYYYFGSYTKK